MTYSDGDTAEAHETVAPMWLTILNDFGLRAQALPRQGRLVLGRALECNIAIDDPSLSRSHAALTIAANEVMIEDLGSRNGTRLGDRMLTRGEKVRIHLGDAIAIGNTTLLLQVVPPTERPRRVLTQDQLEIYLESECARALDGGEPFALARIDLQSADEVSRGTTAERLERIFSTSLRPRDLLTVYAPGQYEILFLRSDRPAAAALVAELQRQMTAQGLAVRTALAVFPADGRTPEEIIDALSRLLRDKRPGARPDKTVVSATLDEVTPVVRRVAQSQINVLIFGETGVGKEVMARTLHELSPRAKQPLVSLNCAALAESLLESELFGYEKGAFTGAAAAKEGLLESADGGTIFLDEIGEMPQAVQAKLLRVIELKQVQRLGALRPRDIDVRFVAATHRDLEAEVHAGRFRQDLLYRLNGMSLVVLPLRERPAEIEPLAELFLKRFAEQMNLERAPLLSRDARQVLRSYRWPGNVRELRNVIERAMVLCSAGMITQHELPIEKMTAKTLEAPARLPSRTAMSTLQPLDPAVVTGELPALPRGSDLDRRSLQGRSVDGAAERGRILEALERTGGNQTEAARLLGVSRRTLINRLEQHGVPRPRKR